MKKSNEIIGLSVISIQEGKQIGCVKDLIIDAAAKSVAALLIDDGKWYLGSKTLPFPSVAGIGEYAITTDTEQNIKDITTYDWLLSEGVQVVGSTALSDKGNILGKVIEIIIDTNGKIAECIIQSDADMCSIPLQQIITFGKDIVIIATEPRQISFAEPAITNNTMDYSTLSAPVQQVDQFAISAIESPEIEAVEPAEQDTNFSLADQNYETQLPEPDEPAPSEAPDTKPDSEPDALAKLFEEKQRQYMLGKKASRKIQTENGLIIIDQGEEITETVIEKAKQAGKFVELSMSIF